MELHSLMRRLARQRHHILFAVSVATLLVLGTWWTIFSRQNIDEIYRHELQELELQCRLAAQMLQSAKEARLPEDSLFEVHPRDSTSPAGIESTLAPAWPDLLLRPKAEVIDRLKRRHNIKIIQVSGEGGLLLLLILITIFMLYSMVLMEGRVRRGMENFLGTVTHELKTPVAGLKALLQTLSMRTLPEENTKRYLEMGLQESSRLQHLVENVLAANRLDHMRIHMSLQPVQLRPFLEREIENKRHYFARSSAPVLCCGEELVVASDPEALRIVIENLLENAYKYSSGNPAIELRAQRIDSNICVSVTDNGIGLESGELEPIFERFYRATENGVKAIKGSGLGLFIARSLSQAMGGHLWAQSQGRGRGSTFILRLRSWQ